MCDMARRKIVLSVAMEPVLVRRLQEMADAQRISRSALVERLVSESLDQESLMLGMLASPQMRKMLAGMASDAGQIKAMAEVIGAPVDHKAAVEATRAIADVADQMAERKREKPASVQRRAKTKKG